MFGRLKGKAQSEPVAEAPAPAGSGAIATPRHGKDPAQENGTAVAATASPRSEEARRRAAVAVRHSLAFSQIVSILMRSPRHRRYPIAALEWLVIPPLLTGQFSIAEAKDKDKGIAAPVAAVLWASVSPEVDKRLSAGLDKPVRLRPGEWRSGDILWLIEAVGDPRALPQLMKHLGETTFKGREVKLRSRASNGQVAVRSMRGAAPAG